MHRSDEPHECTIEMMSYDLRVGLPLRLFRDVYTSFTC